MLGDSGKGTNGKEKNILCCFAKSTQRLLKQYLAFVNPGSFARLTEYKRGTFQLASLLRCLNHLKILTVSLGIHFFPGEYFYEDRIMICLSWPFRLVTESSHKHMIWNLILPSNKYYISIKTVL